MLDTENIEKKIETLFQPILERGFVYGMTMGVSLFCILLMRLFGLDFALDQWQIHTYTILWICVMFGLFYYGHAKLSPLRHFIVAVASVIFVFYIHDSFWILFNVPYIPGFFLQQFSRNFVLLLASFLIIRKNSTFGKRFFLFLGIDLCYLLIIFSYRIFYIIPIYAIFESLPLFGLVEDHSPLNNTQQ